MRILVVTNFFPPEFLGGYEIGCARAAAELVKRGHDVEVLTTGRGEGVLNGVTVRRRLELSDIYRHHAEIEDYVAAKVFNSVNANTLDDVLRDGNFDIVYVFNVIGLGGLQIVDQLSSCGIPWVWHLMDNVPHTLCDGFSSYMLELFECSLERVFRPNAVILMSHALRRELSEQQIRFDAKIHIVPGWVDSRNAITLESNSRDPDECRFVALGSLSASKGTDLIIETAELLMAQGEKFTIDFIGPGNFAKYRRKVREHALEGIVNIRGVISPELVSVTLGSYDGLLFPTWSREPFGFVALEAGMAGVVPIVTTGAGVTEFLEEDRHYIAVDRTHASLRAAMLRVIRDPSVRHIADACREKAVRELSLTNALDRIESILREVIEEGPRRPAIAPQKSLAVRRSRSAALEKVLTKSGGTGTLVAEGQRFDIYAGGRVREWKSDFRRLGPFSYRYWFGRFVISILKKPLIEIVARIINLEERKR